MENATPEKEVKSVETKKVEATEVKPASKNKNTKIIAVVSAIIIFVALCGCCATAAAWSFMINATEGAERLAEEANETFFNSTIESYETSLTYYYEDYGYYPESLEDLDPDYILYDGQFVSDYNVVYTLQDGGQSYTLEAEKGTIDYFYEPLDLSSDSNEQPLATDPVTIATHTQYLLETYYFAFGYYPSTIEELSVYGVYSYDEEFLQTYDMDYALEAENASYILTVDGEIYSPYPSEDTAQ